MIGTTDLLEVYTMAGVWSTTEMSVRISSFELMTYIKQVKMCRKSKENLY